MRFLKNLTTPGFWFGVTAVLLAMCWFNPARAGTTNIGPETTYSPGTASYFFVNVPNAGGLEIEYLTYSNTFKRMLVQIAGVVYDSGIGAAQTMANVPMYAPDGSVVYGTLVITIKSTNPCVRIGRVTVCPHSETLEATSVLITP